MSIYLYGQAATTAQHNSAMSTSTQTPSAMNGTIAIGTIAENFFTANSREAVVVVKVLEHLSNGDVRVADVRDCSFGVTTHQLIQADKTWGVPTKNLRGHDADCKVCHKDGLVYIG